jgi:hypothetical protein
MSIDPVVRHRASTWHVRCLIYVQAAAALVTASWDIVYVARLHGLVDWGRSPKNWGDLEELSVGAFFVGLVLPFFVILAARRSGLRGRSFWVAVATSLALTAFQFFAIFPAVQ